MITVFGEGRGFRVVWLLEEMGLPYRLRPVDLLAGVENDPEFLAINPAGFIPAILDGDVTMVESNAIMEYLIARYGPTPLAPSPHDPAFPAYQQFLHLGEAGLAASTYYVLNTRHRAPQAERQNWTAAYALEQFESRLALVTRQLARSPYLAGDAFTAADISVIYALRLAQKGSGYVFGDIELAYLARVSERDGYKRAVEACHDTRNWWASVPTGCHTTPTSATHFRITPMNAHAAYVPTPDQHDLMADVVRALTLYCFAEFQLGRATTIRITAEGNSFTIADDGRGHVIERAIDGTPYLKFIYTHFDYPFGTDQNAPVQLQGIGMSLINTLCSELFVAVRKQDVTLQLTFRDGRPYESELVNVISGETGIAISGRLSPQTQRSGVGVQKLQQWLLGLLTASPSLKLFFNGHQLHALPQSDAQPVHRAD